MIMSRMLAASAALTLLCACGGGGGGSSVMPGGGGGATPAPTQNFSGLSTTPMAIGDTRTFTPSESGYSGAYTAGSSPSGVLAVSPASGNGPFTAHAQTAGTATVSVSDAMGHTSTATVSVGTVGFGALSSAPLALGEQRAFTPSEAAYAGGYTVTSSAPSVIAVSPGSGNGPFTLSGVAPGQATITVADQAGHQASTTLTVGSSSGSTPAPTNAPTAQPSNAPSSAPTSAPTGAPTSAPTNAPSSAPTATPTPTAGIGLSSNTMSIPWAGTASLTATDAGGSAITTSVANPAVATIVSMGGGNYVISGNEPGSTAVTFTDGSGHTAQLNVTVPASPAPAININPTGITNGTTGVGVDAVTLAPTENGYSGTFTGTITNNGVASMTTGPNNTFLVTAVAPGSSIVTVRDANGNSASTGFTAQ